MISIVAALDEKRGIGKNNDLLFRIPEDFERMKALTSGHPVIMGRRTFESIGRVLPNRTNIVISRNKDAVHHTLVYDTPQVVICSSLEEAITEAKKAPGNEEIIIFGGGQVFKEALGKGLVDKLFLTVVEGDFGADTFFPEYPGFKVIKEEKRESGGYKYRFLTLER
jgi:dihydrofolate reductase